jgi:tRNA G10  N-methylase Trm11
VIGNATLVLADCLTWLSSRESSSIHAVVTDPPYGLKEYSNHEQEKLRAGKGGVWRIPPAFDGSRRAPLPRFTILDDQEKMQLEFFFRTLQHSSDVFSCLERMSLSRATLSLLISCPPQWHPQGWRFEAPSFDSP